MCRTNPIALTRTAQTKIVSRPAPVYYAHRAAFLGPMYDKNYRDGGQGWETASTSSSRSNGSNKEVGPEVGPVLQNLRSRLYYA